jgi:single-strand DNA-binding protein
MASFNKVILIGNMTADPELKQTQGGLSVCSFSIAVNRRFKAEGQQDCDFITIVAWRQQAEFVCRYFKKGQPILVCGQLQTRNWTDNKGEKRYATEVVADEVTFVANRENADGSDKPTQAPTHQPFIPAAYGGTNGPQFEEIPNDSDLPF